jgi:hypothetical protein
LASIKTTSLETRIGNSFHCAWHVFAGRLLHGF